MLLKASAFYVPFLLLLVTAACKKDEVAPRVQFTSHSDLEKVWNREILVFDALDNETVARVEFRLVGNLLGTVEAAP